MDLLGFNYMLKNWVTETCKLLLSRLRVQRGFNYMLKNWVTETVQMGQLRLELICSFNYMLKNWVTETYAVGHGGWQASQVSIIC